MDLELDLQNFDLSAYLYPPSPKKSDSSGYRQLQQQSSKRSVLGDLNANIADGSSNKHQEPSSPFLSLLLERADLYSFLSVDENSIIASDFLPEGSSFESQSPVENSFPRVHEEGENCQSGQQELPNCAIGQQQGDNCLKEQPRLKRSVRRLRLGKRNCSSRLEEMENKSNITGGLKNNSVVGAGLKNSLVGGAGLKNSLVGGAESVDRLKGGEVQEKRAVRCVVCRREFSDKQGMKDHVRKIHFKPQAQCSLCGRRVAVERMKSHKKQHKHD